VDVSSLDDLLPMHLVKKLELYDDTSPLLVSFTKQLKIIFVQLSHHIQ